jgi:hypothetical protein
MIKESMATVILTLFITLLLSTIYVSVYTNAQAQTELQGVQEIDTPQNEDQRSFWTAQYCDIDYKDKPQNNATILALCDTAMQYLSFFCTDAAMAMVEHESCDYLDGVVQTVSKYTESRNLTTIDELLYKMPKSEAIRFERHTAADFESAFQQLFQIDGGKSKFELMIQADKPLMGGEQLERADIVEDEEQNKDSNIGNDDEDN